MSALLQPACLLLGSNIQPEVYLPRALKMLAERFPIECISHAWETAAVGASGPNYLNAAVLLWAPHDEQWMKAEVLRPLEARLGRVRGADKNAPRTIDIDPVVWDGRLLDADLGKYAHRAVPVAELLPDYPDPQTGDPLEMVAQRLALAENGPVCPRPAVLGNIRQDPSKQVSSPLYHLLNDGCH
jgi:2-amino-4-hydroxy-6-hydroxymethyldihydropteridine diphosphokinase